MLSFKAGNINWGLRTLVKVTNSSESRIIISQFEHEQVPIKHFSELNIPVEYRASLAFPSTYDGTQNG